MNNSFLKGLSYVSLLVLTITSCKVTRPYTAPEVNTGGLFRGANTTDTNSIATLSWKHVFTDTTLQRLIGEGINRNLDIKIAYTRIQQAEAYYQQSRAAFFPTLK
jgi:multidrug efflux system outer membrane protein